jgi:hypothetical protein
LSTNPTIQGRQNALIDKLNSIARLNAEHGARAEGGSGVPVVPAEPAASGGSRVLPPDPVPVTPEEEARLQAEFERDWGNQQQAAQVAAPPTGRATARAFVPRGMPSTFVAVNIVDRHVVADNGDTFPISEAEAKQIQSFAFQVMVRELQKTVDKLAEGLGLKEQPKQEEVPAPPRKGRRKKSEP